MAAKAKKSSKARVKGSVGPFKAERGEATPVPILKARDVLGMLVSRAHYGSATRIPLSRRGTVEAYIIGPDDMARLRAIA